MSIFGFSTETNKGGDFTPIIKYDARAGRIFRVDRVRDSAGNYDSNPVDITAAFKALVDFSNVEVGWLDFPPGQAPSMVLVPMGSKLPDQPSERHKNGLRFMLKLAANCGGEQPIREIAGTSKAFLSGIEAVYTQYLAERDRNAGKLPVIVLENTVPVTTGSGQKSSTNYSPIFKLIGWAPRGDLVFVPKAAAALAQQAATYNQQANVAQGNGMAAPSTGSQRAAPPQQTVSADDFG